MRTSICLAALVSLGLTVGCSATPQDDHLTQSPQTTATSADPDIEFQQSSEDTPLEESASDSSNVFVGIVVRKVGNEAVDFAPEEQYEVRVEENLKGDLTGSVTVNLLSLAHEEDHEEGAGTHQSLKDGSTYVFFTRYLEEQGWYTVVPGDGRLTEVTAPLERNSRSSGGGNAVQRARDAVKNARPMTDSQGRSFPVELPNNAGSNRNPASATPTSASATPTSASATPTPQTTN